MSEIMATALFPAIPADGLAEFKEIAAKAVEMTGAEVGTLGYDWFFGDDQTSCMVRERYASSEAVFAHLGNVGPVLGRLVELGGGLKLDVYGDPSPELREALAAFEPRIYHFFVGK